MVNTKCSVVVKLTAGINDNTELHNIDHASRRNIIIIIINGFVVLR